MNYSNDVFTIEGFKNGAVKVSVGEAVPTEFVSCDKPEFADCIISETDLYFRYIAGVLVCLIAEGCDTCIFELKSDTQVIGAKFEFAPKGIGPMLITHHDDFSTLLNRVTENLSNTKEWRTSTTKDSRGNIVAYSY